MELHAKVIVTPKVVSRSVGREWPHINRQLQKTGLSFDHEFTKGAGHATEIANRTIDSGYRYLIPVGVDGTVNEVVNGILHSSNPLSIILGIVTSVTTHVFSFSLGVTEDYNNINACSFLTDHRLRIGGKLMDFDNPDEAEFIQFAVQGGASTPIAMLAQTNLVHDAMTGYKNHLSKLARQGLGACLVTNSGPEAKTTHCGSPETEVRTALVGS
jgi:diacylglycerol kinase (ATP)